MSMSMDMGSIPIFITTRDRCTDLVLLLERLRDHDNVTLVDCVSTYEPMLDFLNETDRKVVRLEENLGHNAPWAAGLVPSTGQYIVTDPDIVPSEECPDDFVEYLSEVVRGNPGLIKAGLGLKIDDLPDHYLLKPEVLAWEGQFWSHLRKGRRSFLYDAPIDATFALYASGVTAPALMPAMRTGAPYVARHMPWYSDSQNPTEEEIYYKEHASRSVTSWVYDDLFDVALRERLRSNMQ